MINDNFEIRDENPSLEPESETILILKSNEGDSKSLCLTNHLLQYFFEFFIQLTSFIFLTITLILIYKTQVIKIFFLTNKILNL